MNNLTRCLILLTLLGIAFAKYHIVIVAGQSNCLNIHTRASDLPACEADSLVPFFYDLYYPPGFAPNDLVCTSDNTWEKLKVVKGDEARTTAYSFFGPEMTLARTLLDNMDSVAIFKYGVAGSDLAYDWGLAVDGGPEIFDKFVTKIRLAEAAMDAAGHDHEWLAATWMQGESDADNLNQASNYYRNLGYFMKCLRDTLKVPDLPFVIGLVADELPLNSYPYREKVLDAQHRRADADDHALVVNTADFEMDTDNVHFNSNGVMDLGEGFAQAILALTAGTAILPGRMEAENELKLLPNPVNGLAVAEFVLEVSAELTLHLYDLRGHMILKRHYGTYSEGKHRLLIPVNNLNSGLYIVRISTGTKVMTNKLNILK